MKFHQENMKPYQKSEEGNKKKIADSWMKCNLVILNGGSRFKSGNLVMQSHRKLDCGGEVQFTVVYPQKRENYYPLILENYPYNTWQTLKIP